MVPEFMVPLPLPASSPQNTLPAPSVSSTPAPVQFRIVDKVMLPLAILRPPLSMSIPPPKVEVAVVEAAIRPVVVKSPLMVEEADDSRPLRVDSPPTASDEEALIAPPA